MTETETTFGPELAAALAAFQADMPKVHKGKTARVPTKGGGSYSYDYADLADVTAVAMPKLAEHGLSFVSCPRQTERGYELVGTLVHKSGEHLTGALPLTGGTEQALGSSLTYLRRYLLGSMTGIVTDDDEDGAAATHAPRQAEQQPPQPTPDELARQVAQGVADSTTEAEVREWGNRAHARELLDVTVNGATVRERVEHRLSELQQQAGGEAA